MFLSLLTSHLNNFLLVDKIHLVQFNIKAVAVSSKGAPSLSILEPDAIKISV